MRMLLLLFFMLVPALAQAQANACSDVPPRTVPYTSGQTVISFTAPEHTAKDLGGSEIVLDYLGEVLVEGGQTSVSNWTIPKSALQLQQGTPANCYSTALPGMTGLLPTNYYVVRVRARGPGGLGPFVASSDRFFLRAAPGATGPPKLAVPTP